MIKKALCVGINYAGTEFALRGCLNDADDWTHLLHANGFTVQQLKESQATRDNILGGLTTLISELHAGDVGVFTYSGHGTWLPDTNGDEPDGKDEAMCPYDMGEDGRNLIVDDELCVVLSKLHADASLVFVADCCHSGTLYRMAPLQDRDTYVKHKMIPPATFTQDPAALAKLDRALTQPVRTNKVLPGLVYFSGCRDNETSADAEIAGRPCGAFSFWATKAFGRGVSLGSTYGDIYADIRKSLPNYNFTQTPQMHADIKLRKTRVFTG